MIRSYQRLFAAPRLAKWIEVKWYALLARIPGTPQFRRAIRRSCVGQVRERLKLLDGLQSLDATTRHNLRSRIRDSEKRLAIVQTRFEAGIVAALPAVLYLLVVLAQYAMAPILPRVVTTPGQEGWSLVALILAPVIMFWPGNWAMHQRSTGLLTATLLLGGWPGILVVAGGALHQSGVTWHPLLISLGTFWIGLAPAWLSIIGMIVLMIAAFLIFERWKRNRYFDDVLVIGFLRVLSVIEQEPHQWDRDTRQHLGLRVRWLAACLEHDMAHRLRIGDPRADAAWQDTCGQMAYAVRSLMGWVRAPSAKTHSSVVERTVGQLLCSVNGYWGDLECLASPHRSIRQILREGVGAICRFCRTLLFAILPFALFTLVQHSPWPFGSGFVEGLQVFSYLWFLIVCCNAWMPNFNSAFAAVKDLLGSLPFSGRPQP